jgi:hypothetical protein
MHCFPRQAALLRSCEPSRARRRPSATSDEGAKYAEELATAVPWMVGLYHSKRDKHKTDVIGTIEDESVDNLVTPVGWDAAGKLLLAKRVVARDLGVPVEAVSRRLECVVVNRWRSC